MFYGWVNVFVLWLGYAVIPMAVYYGFGSMVGPMSKGLGITLSQAALGFTVFLFTMGLTNPVVAMVVNRFGSRLAIFFGAVIFFLAGLSMGTFVNNYMVYIIMYALMGFACSLSAPLALQTNISFWFVRKRATAMSIALTGGGFGAMVFSPLIAKIVASSPTWHTPWFYIAVISGIGGVITLAFVSNKPSDKGLLPDGDKAGEAGVANEKKATKKIKVYKTQDSWDTRSALRSPIFYFILIGGITVLYGAGSIVSMAITYFTGLGIEKVVAAGAIGLFGVISIGGRLGAGVLCDIVEPRYVFAGGFLIQALSIILLMNVSNGTMAYIFSALFGITFGLTYVCLPNLIVNYFGVDNFASINSVLITVALLCGSSAPYITGAIVEATNGFTYAWGIVLVLSAASCLFGILAIPPKKSREDSKVMTKEGEVAQQLS